MRLIDLFEKKEKKGTYAGVHFSKKTIDAIKKYVKDNEIPNPLKADKLHSTVLYSKKYLPEFEAAGKLEEPLIGKPTKFEKWPSQPDSDGNVAMCLVLKFDCEDLVKRHEFLMKQHGGTYDFDEFKPHITFSYDVADLQCKDLPVFSENIEIVEEYGEDLNLDWAKKNTEKSG